MEAIAFGEAAAERFGKPGTDYRLARARDPHDDNDDGALGGLAVGLLIHAAVTGLPVRGRRAAALQR